MVYDPAMVVLSMDPPFGPAGGQTMVTFTASGLSASTDSGFMCQFGRALVPAVLHPGDSRTTHSVRCVTPQATQAQYGEDGILGTDRSGAYFNGNATGVDANEASTLTAPTPVSVSLTTNGVEFYAAPDAFRYLPQVSVTGVWPLVLDPRGGEELLVTGTGFLAQEHYPAWCHLTTVSALTPSSMLLTSLGSVDPGSSSMAVPSASRVPDSSCRVAASSSGDISSVPSASPEKSELPGLI